ncbi:hypothetical protein CONPUDRAFT_162987 [Coniophora puteana RWD-64-598 SS2]|uniref:Uncharacterized protein n=1 Tax=Coniophora puteana (strain RWD-64-598) TaxID=741705 RepID=A0A5M3MWY5_CONPW|nr:uncharacterized protein CONPUDRAFT_162987 [Coniophora puteana RWD-64-598 SS2]EIW83636.1 hypothetical protein CONPUDRAFT_162987 [Coniophora puteana RWD-64-598 SS2]
MSASADPTSGIQWYAQHEMSTMGPRLAYARPLGPNPLGPAVFPRGSVTYSQPILSSTFVGQGSKSCTTQDSTIEYGNAIGSSKDLVDLGTSTLFGSGLTSSAESTNHLSTQERRELATPACQAAPVPQPDLHASGAHFATSVEDLPRDSIVLDICTGSIYSAAAEEVRGSSISSGISGSIAPSLTYSTSGHYSTGAPRTPNPIKSAATAVAPEPPLDDLKIKEEFESKMREALLIPSNSSTDFEAVPLRTDSDLIGIPLAGSKGHYEMLAKLIMWNLPTRTCKIKDMEEKIEEIWPAFKEMTAWRGVAGGNNTDLAQNAIPLIIATSAPKRGLLQSLTLKTTQTLARATRLILSIRHVDFGKS